MKTLVLNFKNNDDLELVKELAVRLNAEISSDSIASKRKSLPKSKFKSEEEFRALGGILKGQLISKEHLRSRAWKKRA